MRRMILSLIFCVLVVSSCLHSTQGTRIDNASKEKPVVMHLVKIPAMKTKSLGGIILPKVVTPKTGVTAEDMVAWRKVNICEMGGIWNFHGSIYSGGLGIMNTNWVAYGGLRYAPNAGLATPEEQVAIAKKINSGNNVPDQNGCNGGW